MNRADALALAIELAGNSLPSFPIAIGWDARKGATSKRPVCQRGHLDATTDRRQLEAMFSAALCNLDEHFGVGVCPGAAGFVVFDVDRKGEVDGFPLAEIEGIPAEVICTTASGGEHRWCRKPVAEYIGNEPPEWVGRGLEVRADAGWIVAPGTVTPWGEWATHDELADAPIVPPAVWAKLRRPSSLNVGHWRPIDRGTEHPGNLAALDALVALGGHSAFRTGGDDDYLSITRPGKTAGTSATIGYLAPGVVKVWSSNWPGLAAGVYDADEIAAFTSSTITKRRRPVELRAFLDQEEEPYDWIVPGLLERGDRTIITGYEGQGKSTLIRQMAVQIASGIHPFTLEPIEARPTMLLDCENSQRQVRRKLGSLGIAAGEDYRPGMMHLDFRPEGIDLTKGDDYAWLDEIVAMVAEADPAPEILLIGPIYKMGNGDPTSEEVAKAVASTLDHLRVKHNLALIIEAHIPYTETATKGKRVERPYGASLWSRWPEFGLFLDPDGAIRHWRGQRDEREWPAKLMRGEPWPWMAVASDDREIARDEPWRPTHCIDAIVALLESQPEREFSQRQVRETLAFQGESYRTQTIGFACEQAAREGLVVVRDGPRNSRLFRVKPVDKSDRFPLVPTGSDWFPEPLGSRTDVRFPLVPGGGYYVPPDSGNRSDVPPPGSEPLVPKKQDLY